MKILYCPDKGLFKGKLFRVRDEQRLNKDDDKIIVNEIGPDYHVYIFQKGLLEKEKKILSYTQLTNFLKENSLPTYFVNTDEVRTHYLMEDVKKEQQPKTYFTKQDDIPSIFTKVGDDVIETEAFIDRTILKEAVVQSYFTSKTYDRVSMTDILEDEKLAKILSLPLNYNGGKITIPTHSFRDNKVYYWLSRMYSRQGDLVPLNEQELHFLKERTTDEENAIKDKVASNIYVREIKRDKLSDFIMVTRFLERYDIGNMCSHIKAEDINKAYLRAYENEDIYSDLGVTIESPRTLKKEH